MDKETMEACAGRPPVYLGLPMHSCAAVKLWKNSKCLNEKEEDINLRLLAKEAKKRESNARDVPRSQEGLPNVAKTKEARDRPQPFGEDPPGVTRAAWSKAEADAFDAGEEKKEAADPTPPLSPSPSPSPPPPVLSPKHKETRTWRDLRPDEWYHPSEKGASFYSCEEAGFSCISYHCARQCINGSFRTRRRQLKRAEARLANKQKKEQTVKDLREEGHTEGDVKRFVRQFQRQEQQMLAEIDATYANKHKDITPSGSAIHQISQCSLSASCRLLQCIPETDDLEEQTSAAVHVQRVSRGGRGRRRAADRKVRSAQNLLPESSERKCSAPPPPRRRSLLRTSASPPTRSS
jgi:hypothetical protein